MHYTYSNIQHPKVPLTTQHLCVCACACVFSLSTFTLYSVRCVALPAVGLLQLSTDGCDVDLQLGLLLGEFLAEAVAVLHFHRQLLHAGLQLPSQLLLQGSTETSRLVQGSSDDLRGKLYPTVCDLEYTKLIVMVFMKKFKFAKRATGRTGHWRSTKTQIYNKNLAIMASQELFFTATVKR